MDDKVKADLALLPDSVILDLWGAVSYQVDVVHAWHDATTYVSRREQARVEALTEALSEIAHDRDIARVLPGQGGNWYALADNELVCLPMGSEDDPNEPPPHPCQDDDGWGAVSFPDDEDELMRQRLRGDLDPEVNDINPGTHE